MNPILKYKEENNLTYREMEKIFGLNYTTLKKLSTYELKIENMSLRNVQKICKVLGVENPFDLIN